jgi:hypothetical protein
VRTFPYAKGEAMSRFTSLLPSGCQAGINTIEESTRYSWLMCQHEAGK